MTAGSLVAMSSPKAPPRRRLTRWLTAAAVALLALGALGQLLRDRAMPLGMLFYVPLVPAGLFALTLDLARAGRSLAKARFVLAGAGAAAAAAVAVPMVGTAPPDAPVSGRPEVRLLHWNVHWGGRHETEAEWQQIIIEIVRHRPDLVVLSEAPNDSRLDDLRRRLRPEGRAVSSTHRTGLLYSDKMAVLAPGLLEMVDELPAPNGALVTVRADVAGRALRLLVVDGRSDPWRSRLPFVAAVRQRCRDAADAGRPIDVVVGDFNTPSRSVGFDGFEESDGYRLAGRRSGGWRATWPAECPLYDIDHVWVRAGVPLLGCELFRIRESDHRGQLVRLQ